GLPGKASALRVRSRLITQTLKPRSSRCLPAAPNLARRPARQTVHPPARGPGREQEDPTQPSPRNRRALPSLSGSLPCWWTEWLLLAHKVVFVDGDRNALLLPRLVHAQHLACTADANGIGQCDLGGQRHHKFDGCSNTNLRFKVDEDAARAYIACVSGHLMPAVI